jgi:hypothetical protein
MATAYAFSSLVPDSSFPARTSVGMLYTIEFQYTLAGAVVTGDTFTTPANALPANGIRIAEVEVITPVLDTNATPTGTFSVGDANLATRFISAAPMGVTGITSATYQIRQVINIAQGLTAGVVSTGTNYLYGSGTAPRLVVTLAGTVATAQTAGTIRMRVSFYCVDEN